MQASHTKSAGWVVALCAAMLLGIVLTGCQTGRHHMGRNHDVMCPMCQMQTRTTSGDGLIYAKHVCPGCRAVYNTGTSDEAAALTKVHVCDRCKTTVEKCPMCAKK